VLTLQLLYGLCCALSELVPTGDDCCTVRIGVSFRRRLGQRDRPPARPLSDLLNITFDGEANGPTLHIVESVKVACLSISSGSLIRPSPAPRSGQCRYRFGRPKEEAQCERHH
jgi:hypothetical protein